MRNYSRPFVGFTETKAEVFRFVGTPNKFTHPSFTYVVGPFRTTRGAKFYEKNHGTCLSVNDAENRARKVL